MVIVWRRLGRGAVPGRCQLAACTYLRDRTQGSRAGGSNESNNNSNNNEPINNRTGLAVAQRRSEPSPSAGRLDLGRYRSLAESHHCARDTSSQHKRAGLDVVWPGARLGRRLIKFSSAEFCTRASSEPLALAAARVRGRLVLSFVLGALWAASGQRARRRRRRLAAADRTLLPLWTPLVDGRNSVEKLRKSNPNSPPPLP
jgi:hypothetical protein